MTHRYRPMRADGVTDVAVSGVFANETALFLVRETLRCRIVVRPRHLRKRNGGVSATG